MVCVRRMGIDTADTVGVGALRRVALVVAFAPGVGVGVARRIAATIAPVAVGTVIRCKLGCANGVAAVALVLRDREALVGLN